MRFQSMFATSAALGMLAGAALARPGAALSTGIKSSGPMNVPCIDPSDPNCGGTGTGMIDSPGQFPADIFLLNFNISFQAVVTAGVSGPNLPPLGGFLRRTTLNAAQTYGAGFVHGFGNWPDVGQMGLPGTQGDFTGMNYPFRDLMNSPEFQPYIPGGYDASNDNGFVSTDGSTLSGIFGRQNFASFGSRGNPGFGIIDAVNLFSFEFVATDFTPRTVTVTLSGSQAQFESASTGQIFTVPIESSTVEIMIIPGASTGAAMALASGLAARRRRR